MVNDEFWTSSLQTKTSGPQLEERTITSGVIRKCHYTSCDARVTRREFVGRARYRSRAGFMARGGLSSASHRRNPSPKSVHTDVGLDIVCAGTGICFFSPSTFVLLSLSAPHSLITDSTNSL